MLSPFFVQAAIGYVIVAAKGRERFDEQLRGAVKGSGLRQRPSPSYRRAWQGLRVSSTGSFSRGCQLRKDEVREERKVTEDAQDRQQGQEAAGQAGQQVEQTADQAQDTAGGVTGQAQGAVGGLGGGDDEGGGPLGGTSGQAGEVAGQAQELQNTAGGLAGGGQGNGQQDEGSYEDYSHSDSNTTTVENDKSPEGPLSDLLNLEILPSPESDTTTLESGDSANYQEPDEDQQGAAPTGE